MVADKRNRYRRIVVKVGSSTITHPGGKLNLTRIDHILRQLVDLKNSGKEVLLVTSGAIGAGMGEMGFTAKPKLIPEQQATAAIGQGLLMGVYNKFLREYGEKGAQILLTASDLEDRTRYLNAFNTLLTLLKNDVIPIVNENDTIVTDEIKFGDNDTLSARVAGLIEADLLINLSDIDGLYNGDPRQSTEGLELIHIVDKLTPEIENLAQGNGSNVGTGGMKTKIEAAKIAVNSGITMVIGPGYEQDILLKIVKMVEEDDTYNLGTVFLPLDDSLSKKKQWLSFNVSANGSIEVDKGAEKALLHRGKSLLPGGITAVKGKFSPGDLVNIINEEKDLIGKGLVNYSAVETEKIKGCHSDQIHSLLGYINQEEVIHRDNMVIY